MSIQTTNKITLYSEIIDKARDLGASLAGIVNIHDLKSSPSHLISGKMVEFGGVGTKKVEGKKSGQVEFPDNAHSAVVIAVKHPFELPELDWWVKGLKGGTQGNLKLISILSELAQWLEKERNIKSIKPAYHIEHGAVYMKDAAVLAGLGCIGKNNMLITPEFGPRVRLRVMLIDIEIPSTGQINYDPCDDCKEYCKKACPQNAFDKQIYFSEEFAQNELPSRTGVYNRI
ncbi:MAG: epoxyqueuosine reductase, partial [Desulfamplus sp.]|nr:epoxyqueuosine reductase [Desulfamplus sp.]